MKAGIFQAEDVAVLHLGDGRFRASADAILGEGHRPVMMRATAAATGRSDVFRIGPFGPAEMRQQDHLAAFVGDFGDGRRDLARCGSRR